MPRRLLGVWLLCSCGGNEGVELRVEVRTDYVPGVEFVGVESQIAGMSEREPATLRSRFAEGVVAARFTGLRPRAAEMLRVGLLSGSGDEVAVRTVLVPLEADVAITVFFTRNCAGVVCDGDSTCLDGRCVDAACTDGSQPSCDVGGCDLDSDCQGATECARAACANGVCLSSSEPSACDDGHYCHPAFGCVPEPEPPSAPDASMPLDASLDAGAPLDAQTLPLRRSWEQLSPATVPPRRARPHAAFRDVDDAIYVYGGERDGARLSDMWRFDGADWSMVCDPCAPGPRIEHALVYDRSRDVLVLYGGADSMGMRREDLWEWDGTTWSERVVSGTSPGRRRGIYAGWDDDAERVVVYGGDGGDSRTYEYVDGVWSAVTAADGVTPGALNDPAGVLVHHPAHGMVLYSGLSGVQDTLWAWRNGVWTQLCTQCTGLARQFGTLVYDPRGGDLLLVGGQRFLGFRELSGTWVIPHSQPRLSEDPLPVMAPALAFHRGSDRLILIGGRGEDGCGGDCNWTWALVAE